MQNQYYQLVAKDEGTSHQMIAGGVQVSLIYVGNGYVEYRSHQHYSLPEANKLRDSLIKQGIRSHMVGIYYAHPKR